EAAREQDPDAALGGFLPPRTHPLYPTVVRELVRIDLEYGWDRGRPTPLDGYRHAFPDVFANPDALKEIAFEEYRQGREAGDNRGPDEYLQRYGVETAGWPPPAGRSRRLQPATAPRSDRNAAPDLPNASPAAALPEVGTTFLGFQIVREL